MEIGEKLKNAIGKYTIVFVTGKCMECDKKVYFAVPKSMDHNKILGFCCGQHAQQHHSKVKRGG